MPPDRVGRASATHTYWGTGGSPPSRRAGPGWSHPMCARWPKARGPPLHDRRPVEACRCPGTGCRAALPSQCRISRSMQSNEASSPDPRRPQTSGPSRGAPTERPRIPPACLPTQPISSMVSVGAATVSAPAVPTDPTKTGMVACSWGLAHSGARGPGATRQLGLLIHRQTDSRRSCNLLIPAVGPRASAVGERAVQPESAATV
jgi:hypothetical protein